MRREDLVLDASLLDFIFDISIYTVVYPDNLGSLPSRSHTGGNDQIRVLSVEPSGLCAIYRSISGGTVSAVIPTLQLWPQWGASVNKGCEMMSLLLIRCDWHPSTVRT